MPSLLGSNRYANLTVFEGYVLICINRNFKLWQHILGNFKRFFLSFTIRFNINIPFSQIGKVGQLQFTGEHTFRSRCIRPLFDSIV